MGASSRAHGVELTVHKNENFFGSDFEFCTASLLVMLNIKICIKNFRLDHYGGRKDYSA
jgi:hypothetical protein